MAGNGSRGGSGRGAGGGVNLNPRSIGGAGSGTILRDSATRSFRRMSQGPYGAGGRNERLMAAAGRMSRSMMSTSNGKGLRRQVEGDFYRPGTGNKFNGVAVRKGRRVTVSEKEYPRDGGPARFTGNTYRYRMTEKPGSRPVGAATTRRRLPNR
jgi:hypothetical protein